MYYSFHIGCILRQNFIFCGKIEVDMFIFIVHPSPSLLDLDLSFLSFFLANITDEYFDLRTG